MNMQTCWRPLSYLAISLFSLGITPVKAAELVQTGGSLTSNNYSHLPQSFAGTQSAIAQFATPEETFLGVSDPQFVTGPIFIPNPSATPIPVDYDQIPGGEQVSVSLDFPEVQGSVSGSSVGLTTANDFTTTLSSKTQFSVNSPEPYLLSTVGQAGWEANFNLDASETFSFDFAGLTAWETDAEVLRQEQEYVIYFYTLPIGVEIENPHLIFSFFPELTVTASDPRMDVGLVQIVSDGQQHQIFGNRDPYFDVDLGDPSFDGFFTYTAEVPTVLTTVAYSSSLATSTNATVPEPYPLVGLLGLCFYFIKPRK